MLIIKVASNITKLPQISYTLFLSEGSTRISYSAWLILYWTEQSQCLRWKPGWNMINLRWTRSFLLVGMACQVYPLKARPGRQKDNNTSLYVYVWYESQTGINLKSGEIGSFFLLVCQQEGTIHTHLAEPGRQRDNNTSLRSLNLQQRGQIVVARNILGVADEKARLEMI